MQNIVISYVIRNFILLEALQTEQWMKIIFGQKDLPRTPEMTIHISYVFCQTTEDMFNSSHIGRIAST